MYVTSIHAWLTVKSIHNAVRIATNGGDTTRIAKSAAVVRRGMRLGQLYAWEAEQRREQEARF
jgi:molybdopterin-guanine dinucleotide biosynthesis protein